MFNHTELQDDLLVEEGHYLERIQNEALEEGFLYHTVRDIEALIKAYGAAKVCGLFQQETLDSLQDVLC